MRHLEAGLEAGRQGICQPEAGEQQQCHQEAGQRGVDRPEAGGEEGEAGPKVALLLEAVLEV